MHRADNLTTFICRLYWNLGASNSWNPQGLSRPLMGFLCLYNFLWVQRRHNCPLASSFSKLRHGTIPAKSASANVSFYTNNSNMPNFELWHNCRKWAIYWQVLDVLTHWGRVTQICVFNTRLFSLHSTLNYAIHRACLRMVLLTDVYRNLTSLWINL